ncbi:MAG TPA: contractile injection system tape measure protein, partial [Rhodothermales bacterium]|nr:contractile injection system tape measure protein [Rhodothermales bacterium]
MAESTHRVQKVVFDLACGDQTTAFKARRRLARAFGDSLGSVLEEVFDGHSPNGRPYRIQRMEVDLGVLDLERFDDHQIRELLLSRLRRKFLELGHDDMMPVAETLPAADAFIHFLVTGRVRWDSQAQTLPEIERMILDLDESDNLLLARRLIQVFSNRAARIRFGYQFGLPFFLWIVGLLHPDAPRVLETAALRLRIDLALPEIRSRALDAIVTAVKRSDEPSSEAMDRALEKIVTGSEDAQAEETDTPPVQDEDDD